MKNIKLWTQEEDNILQMIIQEHGVGIWKKISSILHSRNCFRSPKQCRDRWVNYLKNQNDSSPFTQSEKSSAVEYFSVYGPQWSKLSELIPSRTENQIKNFINSTLRRNIRNFNKGKLVHERIDSNSIDILKISEVRNLLLLKTRVAKDWFRNKFLPEDILKQVEEIKKKKEKERYGDKKLEALQKKNENPEVLDVKSFGQFEYSDQEFVDGVSNSRFVCPQENYLWQFINFGQFAYFDPALNFFT